MDITSIFVCAVVFLGLYKMLELFVRRGERVMMIDKIKEVSSARLDNSIINLLSSEAGMKFTALKTGACAMGIGLGCFLGALTLVYLPNDIRWHVSSSIFSGMVVFFGGLGLIIGFVIENSMRKRHSED